MLFNSYEFLFIFLPITYFGWFSILNRFGRSASFTFLAIASLCFYGYWKYEYLVLILGSMLVNFLVGEVLSNRNLIAKTKKVVLVFGLGFNLLLLGYFKYFNFLLDNINNVGDFGFANESIFLPLAISFFTFQQIAYLVDAYQGKTSEYNFNHYLLFISFFPQLIAGPIVHHSEMMPQFNQNARAYLFDINFCKGLTWFIIGLFKKVVIADTLANYATPVFFIADSGSYVSFMESWIGVLAYSLQLYFDFSGYSDMAIGLAMMFGIQLPFNFESPYKSRSIVEFWRKWHMTLSRFLRDYLYIPLGGNKKGKHRRYINLFLTMLLGGLWHGASWNFVIWGALHGSYLMVNHAWSHMISGKKFATTFLYSVLSVCLTFLAVIAAWVVFRAETFDGAMRIYSSLIGHINLAGETIVMGSGIDHLRASIAIAAGLVIVFFMPNTRQTTERLWGQIELNKIPYIWFGAISLSVMFVLSLSLMNRVSEFLYFQF